MLITEEVRRHDRYGLRIQSLHSRPAALRLPQCIRRNPRRAGAENHRIVGVVNDSVGSSKLDAFKKAFPDRLINVGIAEQDMVGVAAGWPTVADRVSCPPHPAS
jgi:deoxyxylulose-5-phosphate synthase